MIECIIEERRKHPTWGSRKIRARLQRAGVEDPPASSTIGDILKRRDMVKPRRRRGRRPHGVSRPLTEASYANHVWTIDHKGWFRTRDGRRCDPLTVKDLFSRYMLGVKAVPDQSYERAREALIELFSIYGMPRIIRSDNGSSFASTGVGRLSRLGVWLLLLDILPEYIAPGHPEQNGSHEQTHRILKDETTRPPKANRQAQQRRFNRWREEYNQERPHESLGMKSPTELYECSQRPYDGVLHEPSYPEPFAVRRVRSNGQIKWQGKRRFIGEALIGQRVGIELSEDGIHRVFFASIPLGNLHDVETGGLRPTASTSS